MTLIEDVKNLSYFHTNLTRQEANAILRTSPDGRAILRSSSLENEEEPPCVAISFKENGEIRHLLFKLTDELLSQVTDKSADGFFQHWAAENNATFLTPQAPLNNMPSFFQSSSSHQQAPVSLPTSQGAVGAAARVRPPQDSK